MEHQRDHSSCGVGFVASLKNEATHANLLLGLRALVNLEHRGGSSPDGRLGDGAGVMTDIPRGLLGLAPDDAVANLFVPNELTTRVRALRIFEETFRHLGLDVYHYREVPVQADLIPAGARSQMPGFLMAYVARPAQCTSRHSFEKMLYTAKQLTRSRLREAGILRQFFFSSLSAGTVVYKALLPSEKLSTFYPDLQSESYLTRFVLFHRRFSTNTVPAWDTAQPFRMVGHNGEINTISGNRNWAYARERALGLQEDELLTHIGISDSGSVNEMIEALMFRSSIPHPEDIMAILMPRANDPHPFYKFWGRAMEAWDGPALFTYSDGRVVGARLDRNGFRPCRWATTDTHFFLSSEAGSFEIPPETITAKGSLMGGGSVRVELKSGDYRFDDASQSRENRDASFDARLTFLERLPPRPGYQHHLHKLNLFNYTEEDLLKHLGPMIRDGKEGIGSMGDTARLAFLSDQTRSLFDFFYQRFAQVTNPPLDYIREKLVTDMMVVLGRRPNIFEPKELVPLKAGIELPGPVLTLGQMEFLRSLDGKRGFENAWPGSIVLDTTFPHATGPEGMKARIEELRQITAKAIKDRVSLLILSDRQASAERAPIPSVLILSSIVQGLNQGGMRMRTALVVETGEVKSSHGLAVLIGFGAAAVCPYLPLELARFGHPALPVIAQTDEMARELRCVEALEMGLLRIMAKIGISSVRSYQAAENFSILGLGPQIHARFFPRQESLVGGLELEELMERWLRNWSETPLTSARGTSGLIHNYLLKEHPKLADEGEQHSMTLARSKKVHKLVRLEDTPENQESQQKAYREYREMGEASEPLSLRHLLSLKPGEKPLPLIEVQPRAEILKTFGSGAMSFGAISAESQRDIILAMKQIGGRSNSGEGGENPYYFTEGISASIKQLASGRFGVTAEYLIAGNEIQIKIAQGAKPGEGGQLMAAKVGPEIARARHSDEKVDLISPPPMHDIYSIEDLKQLIYECRQLKPEALVSVKLVSGDNIGTIAVGVAKAGADIIQISGHDGGTGAAALSSMKHAGLPWELGLSEVHRSLVAQGVRENILLRVDGGLSTGKDLIIAAILGADEFDFGKLLLIAEGCIMARVCEKNTCPTGIATHDPKFKRLYRGKKEHIIRLLEQLAEETREHLAHLGVSHLRELVGRTHHLQLDPRFATLVRDRHIDLSRLLIPAPAKGERQVNPYIEPVSPINQKIVDDMERRKSLPHPPEVQRYSVRPADRAVLATWQGRMAHARRTESELPEVPAFEFRGSAGQGFAVFLTEGMKVRLVGEANDSVAKSMSGGELVLVPFPESPFRPEAHTLIGNCALYGATGGTLFVRGLAGNRFAVRNSGAVAVVEGVGMHACEYMTRGTVVILGPAGVNLGAGMSGGTLFIRAAYADRLHGDYVGIAPWEAADQQTLHDLLTRYHRATGSETAAGCLAQAEGWEREFIKVVPKARLAAKPAEMPEAEAVISKTLAPVSETALPAPLA